MGTDRRHRRGLGADLRPVISPPRPACSKLLHEVTVATTAELERVPADVALLRAPVSPRSRGVSGAVRDTRPVSPTPGPTVWLSRAVQVCGCWPYRCAPPGHHQGHRPAATDSVHDRRVADRRDLGHHRGRRRSRRARRKAIPDRRRPGVIAKFERAFVANFDALIGIAE